MASIGIPIGNFPAAYSLTLPGYAAAVASRSRRRGLNLWTANAAFQTALNSEAIDASQIQMHRDMATQLYKLPGGPAGMAGLGDYIDEVTDLLDSGAFYEPEPIEPPPQETSGGSWWGEVLKTFAGPIGLGVAGRIAGQNPWAKPIVVAPEAPMSTPVKIALAGGGLLVGAYVLSRILKK
jgi:hypothetical protein